MSLILYNSNGSVTQVDKQPELPNPPAQILMSLFVGDIDPTTLAFAYASDSIVYATPDSRFQFSNLQTTTSPIVFRLADRIGTASTLELLVAARTVNADEALSTGIIDGIFSVDEFNSRAAEISKLSQSSITQALSLVRQQRGLTAKQALLLERYNFALRFSSADQKEGIDAFLTKRKPRFRNNDLAG
jgi:enoyl-CoA hydratase/carnithine racemase